MDEHFWFQGKRTIRPSANVSPIISCLGVILQIPNQMWITMEENLRLVLLCDPRSLGLLGAPKAKPLDTSSIGGMKHPICQPQEHLSQINIMAVLKTFSHNIHLRLAGTIAKDGSIWPSTLERWHDAQLLTWSFHVRPYRPSNNIPKGKTFHTRKITRPVVTSKVVHVVYCK